MTTSQKNNDKYDRPRRVEASRAARQLIEDDYPAGYLAELARPLAVRGRPPEGLVAFGRGRALRGASGRAVRAID